MNRIRQILALVMVAATLGCPVWAQKGSRPAVAPSDGGGEKRFIAKLVSQLGDEQWKVRDSAAEQLVRIGKPALPALREALTSDDLEVVVRARNVISEIFGLAQKGLAPLRAEVGVAFEKADYATMVNKAKLVVEVSESPAMLDWLWLGHA